MASSEHPNVLKKRYGKAQGEPRLTREDRIDLELAQDGLREIREHPESLVPIEEIKQRYGIK